MPQIPPSSLNVEHKSQKTSSVKRKLLYVAIICFFVTILIFSNLKYFVDFKKDYENFSMSHIISDFWQNPTHKFNDKNEVNTEVNETSLKQTPRGYSSFQNPSAKAYDRRTENEIGLSHKNIVIGQDAKNILEYFICLNKIVVKFLQDISYNDELQILKKLTLRPFRQDIADLVEQLTLYQDTYLNVDKQMQVTVFPQDTHLLNMIITIKKPTSDLRDRLKTSNKLKMEINNLYEALSIDLISVSKDAKNSNAE